MRRGRRGCQVRPFCSAAEISHQGYSRLLQRALTDFGAEESFERAAQRVREHYGIEVPSQRIRQSVYEHGKAIAKLQPPGSATAPKILITELDGSMVPVVTAGTGPDKRKGKTVFWREARLCCARSAGSVHPVYGGTFGTAEVASLVWRQTAQSSGLGPKTYVHGLGDGAEWIMDKFKDNFATQGRYLLDFYHLSEYLAAAGQAIKGEKKSREWLHRQQGRLLQNQWSKVLKALEPHRESVAAAETPVEDAWRYLHRRKENLDYKAALLQGLPIGSGEIESGHRHIIQKRMKLAGSWWKETNAQIMLNLRIARANNLWDAYWSQN